MDFSNLTDDQLLQLIQAALDEAIKRGTATAFAARDIYMDKKEEAQIKAEALARAQAEAAEKERRRIEEKAKREAEEIFAAQQHSSEAEKTATSWKRRKAIGCALEEWGVQEDWQINVWSRGADKRVYVEGGGDRTWAWKMCLYIAGNSYNAPNSLAVEGQSQIASDNPLSTKEGRATFKKFLAAINEHWKGLKVSRSEIESFDGKPDEKHLQIYRQALQLETAEVKNV